MHSCVRLIRLNDYLAFTVYANTAWPSAPLAAGVAILEVLVRRLLFLGEQERERHGRGNMNLIDGKKGGKVVLSISLKK